MSIYDAVMRYFACRDELERLFPHSMRRECRDQVRASFGLGPDPYGEWL